MRTRAIVIAIVAALWLVVGAAAALAKGPKSATISGPGIDEPIEVRMVEDQNLASDLLRQTQLWYGPSYNATLEARPAGDLGTAHTLRWVNYYPGGEEPIIVQYLYLDAPGGPVIHTPMQPELEKWGGGVVGWFRAPDRLRETLAAFDVPVATSPPKVVEPPVAKPPVPGPTAAAAAPQPVTSVAPDTGTPVGWPGVAIAASLAALVAGAAWFVAHREVPAVR